MMGAILTDAGINLVEVHFTGRERPGSAGLGPSPSLPFPLHHRRLFSSFPADDCVFHMSAILTDEKEI